MADDLKRVGLVFKEDGAVDFKKSLQEVNLELNKNYNQFKLTQAQWDNSTKSTEKLRAEQEYLKNAYEIQTDKVNTLKMQLSDLENAEEKNTTAIKKKRNELTSAEVKLETYNKRIKEIEQQLKNTGKGIEEFGTKIENSGKKIENAGKKLSAFSAATGSALTLSLKSAIDFEDAFVGVEKTVDGTAEQMEELKQGIRNMAKEIPSSTTEISAVAEAAGQLGIQTENILDFTRVMIDLGNSTNLSAEEAASSLAKFANVTKMSADDYEKLGSTIVALGNNFATTEADIVQMATRLAATGELVGLSQSQILSLATAMSSVGIEAEAGGTAMSKLLKQIQTAVETGSDSLNDFAKVAGMTADEFKDAFEKDAVKALSAFIAGLNDTERNGKSAIGILNDMDIKEVRLSNTILSLANASDVMNKAVELGSEAWEDNTALTNEANKRYDTLKSKIQIAVNKLKDMSITVGNKLMPSVEKIVNGLEKWIKKFESLSDEQVDMIVKIGLLITAAGPLVTILGKITSTIGGTIKGVGTFVQAIQVATGNITSTSEAVNGLAGILKNTFSPTGLVIAAVATGIGVLAAHYQSATQEARELAKAAEENLKETLKEKEAIDELKASIDNNTQSELNHLDRTKDLWTELQKITDENGKIKEGYENRAKVITGDLSEALGTEITITDNVIDKYKELQNEMDNLILKKQAEVILNGSEEKYNKAISDRDQKMQELIDKQEELNKAIKKEADLYDEDFKEIEDKGIEWTQALNTDYKNWKSAKEEVKSLQSTVNSLQDTVSDYTKDIQDYQYNYELYTKGTTESLQQMVDELGKTYTKNGETVELTYKKQIQAQQYYLENAKMLNEEAIKNNNDVEMKKTQTTMEESNRRLYAIAEELKNMTSIEAENSPDIIEGWKQMATNSYNVYFDILSNAPPELSKKIEEMTGVTLEQTPELVNATQDMIQQVIEQIEKNPEFKQEALSNLYGFLNGLEDGKLREFLKTAGVEDAEKVIQGIRQGNLAESEGLQILRNLQTGLSNKSWKNSLFSTARSIASTLSGLLTVKASVNGKLSNLPGHKSGLDYVPKDNYVARLHKGERVLTAEENKAYTAAENNIEKNTNNTVNNTQEIDYNKMANAFLKALNSCKLTLDEDGFAKIVKNELYEVI